MNDKEKPDATRGEIPAMRRMSIQTFESGTQIFEEGEPITGVHYLQSGRVALLRCIGDNAHCQTHIATAGDILGMPEVLEGSCYQNSAVALEQSSTHLLSKPEFLQMIRANPAIVIESMRRICQRLDCLEEHLDDE
jgi:CRP-like cAMP-binding protein